ncbi:MAG: Crp/Fnr family transcriptional regulator [Deltaproteobacteria bacterium]
MDKPALLRRCALFSCLSPKALAACAALASVRRFHKGETVFEEGARADGFFVVADGRVKIYKLSARGEEHILHLVEPVGAFAEAAVFGRARTYPAFAQALAPTVCLFIPARPLLDLLRSDFSLTLAVLASMDERLRAFNTVIEELALKDADARLARYLLDRAARTQKDAFELGARKAELAGRLGIAAETFSRVLGRFKKKRLICVEGKAVRLLDKKGLSRIAGASPASS